jgi:monoamine oxidase
VPREEATAVAGARPEVLVIGAGFAGLACAVTLQRAGVPFLVLEAKGRVGGRVHTDTTLLDGRPVEAGAMMVHGRDASVLRWLSEFRMTTKKVPDFRGARLFLRGKLRSPLGIALSGWEPLRSSIQALRTLPRAVAKYKGPDVTLDRFLEEKGALPTAARFVGAMYGSVNAADPDEVSVRGLAEEANVASLGLPWANYQVLEGFEEIARRRAEGLGDAIRLNARVDRIERSPDHVTVHATGPGGPETHEAAAAVVTVSLGVLQARRIAFDPPLPEEKVRAIDALGWGHVQKPLLVFDEGLRHTVLGKATSLASGAGSFYFLPYHGRTRGPIVIEGFLAGGMARSLAGKPEAEALDAVLKDLEAMTRIADLRSHLLRARFVDWSSDPDIRGGYTFPKIGGGLAQRRILAEPLDGVLFFAGEATHYAGEYATVHGALDSGERAAHEVVRSLKERKLLA